MTQHFLKINPWSQIRKFLSMIHIFVEASRPEWCFIFSGVVLMLEIYFKIPLENLWIGILSIFLFGWGHFSLNALSDIKSDRINPREFSLRNPFTKESRDLTDKQIYYWVTFLWLSVYILNIAFIPNWSIPKIIAGTIIFGFAFLGSISYSIPKFGRLKAKPVVDLISTALIFAFFIPLYLILIPAEFNFIGLSFNIILPTSIERFFEGLLFTNLLLLGIHMPTVLGDIHQDKIVGDYTTAVWLENKQPGSAYLLTALLIIIRVLGFGILNIYLMTTAVLIPSIIPFFLGLIECVLVLYMIRTKSRQSVVNLWKGVILTSIAGGILFGILYFLANPLELIRYLAWFL